MDDLDLIKKHAGLNKSLSEGKLNGTIGNFDSLVNDMKNLMARGKTIHVIAREAHVSDLYKGDIYEYRITVEDDES